MSTDIPDFYKEAWKTCSGRAAKPFKCCECSGEILKGELYLEITGKWSGDVGTYRTHKICAELRDAQRATFKDAGRDWDEMPGIGQLVEAAYEDAQEGDDFPEYWPKGVWPSRTALRRYVETVHTP